jgi:flavin reductase (DIM6/NTAB) family NADH-FMN oxidoreductase RutF
MSDSPTPSMISIEPDDTFWNRFFTVHGLFLVGSKESDGSFNLAPKHMGMPLGFSPYFAFIGTPRKTTYQNIAREKVFTLSFPKPDQIIPASLSASPRETDSSKPVIDQLPTTAAKQIDGIFLEHSYLQLECKLHEILGHYGEWEMIVGKIVAAHVDQQFLRKESVDDNDLIHNHPLLAYLHPDRHAKITGSTAVPLPKNFKR